MAGALAGMTSLAPGVPLTAGPASAAAASPSVARMRDAAAPASMTRASAVVVPPSVAGASAAVVPSPVAGASAAVVPPPVAGASAAVPSATVTPSAVRVPDVPVPSSSAVRYLQSTLHVQPAVAACVTALNRAVRTNPRYDRLVQLDRYVIRARVRHADAIFSIPQPVNVDTLVVIKGSARVRRQWTWQPVSTRCGLKAGQVVAVAITPRDAPARSEPLQSRKGGADLTPGGGTRAADMTV